MMTRFWLRKHTRVALQGNWDEMFTLRHRLQLATQELNEWRWKVGGADYKMTGQEALQMIDEGMRQKGYSKLDIDSVDLWSANLEPES